jgi:hypothetical protein
VICTVAGWLQEHTSGGSSRGLQPDAAYNQSLMFLGGGGGCANFVLALKVPSGAAVFTCTRVTLTLEYCFERGMDQNQNDVARTVHCMRPV